MRKEILQICALPVGIGKKQIQMAMMKIKYSKNYITYKINRENQ